LELCAWDAVYMDSVVCGRGLCEWGRGSQPVCYLVLPQRELGRFACQCCGRCYAFHVQHDVRLWRLARLCAQLLWMCRIWWVAVMVCSVAIWGAGGETDQCMGRVWECGVCIQHGVCVWHVDPCVVYQAGLFWLEGYAVSRLNLYIGFYHVHVVEGCVSRDMMSWGFGWRLALNVLWPADRCRGWFVGWAGCERYIDWWGEAMANKLSSVYATICICMCM
jgi:hypothetical protein